MTRSRKVIPKSRAGWLTFEKVQWMIQPCESARIPFKELEAIGRGSDPQWLRKRTSARERYEKWTPSSLDRDFYISNEGYPVRNGRFTVCCRLARRSGQGAGVKGTLIFTSNTGARNHAKKMDFFFYDSSQKQITVDPDVFRKFKNLADLEGSDWEWWRRRYRSREVFHEFLSSGWRMTGTVSSRWALP